MQKIIIVEDDEDIRETVLYALQSAGFKTEGFESGADFFGALEQEAAPALVLLDVMLPGEDGLSILKKLRIQARTKTLPVIMLTAKGSEIDKVKGLNTGADDYVAKPFGVMELISRVRAVLRRSAAAPVNERLAYGAVTVDMARRAVHVAGEKAPLTYKEYELLCYLMHNAGIVLSRDKMMDEIWGCDFAGESRTLDMHIRTLRQKLGGAGTCIKTVRSVGYKLGD